MVMNLAVLTLAIQKFHVRGSSYYNRALFQSGERDTFDVCRLIELWRIFSNDPQSLFNEKTIMRGPTNLFAYISGPK